VRVPQCAACLFSDLHHHTSYILGLCPPGILHPYSLLSSHLLVQIRSEDSWFCTPLALETSQLKENASREVSREGCNSVVLILADVLCAIRVNVFLARLIVEIVTTCVACTWVISASPTSKGVCPFICLCSVIHITRVVVFAHGHGHCPCLTDMTNDHVCLVIHIFTRVVYLFCARLEYWFCARLEY
jgi:hypothetical protein